MAIDTNEKKLSLMGMGLPFKINPPTPTQEGFTDAQKQFMLFQYSGISWIGSILSKGIKIVASTIKNSIQMFSGIVDKIQSTFDIR